MEKEKALKNYTSVFFWRIRLRSAYFTMQQTDLKKAKHASTSFVLYRVFGIERQTRHWRNHQKWVGKCVSACAAQILLIGCFCNILSEHKVLNNYSSTYSTCKLCRQFVWTWIQPEVFFFFLSISWLTAPKWLIKKVIPKKKKKKSLDSYIALRKW